MENAFENYSALFNSLGKGIGSELEQLGTIKQFDRGSMIVKTGSYMPFVPIVLSGLVKVYTSQPDSEKELLLYYIKPNESCIMTFMAAINSFPSKIEAIAETDTLLLLIPAENMEYLMEKYRGFNALFLNQFNTRYLDLLSTINSLVFDGLDKRLMQYLIDKRTANHKTTLLLKHKDIANDLGTAREVVTRLLKKLECEGKLKVKGKEIEILEM